MNCTSDDIRDQSLSMVAAMIVALEEHVREVKEEIAHHRSVLRNAFPNGCKTWSDDTYVVAFRPSTFHSMRRVGHRFKRVPAPPHMFVERKVRR